MAASSREEYERFIYSLPHRYPFISFSALVVKPLGATIGKVEGEVHFHHGIRLKVLELIDFAKDLAKAPPGWRDLFCWDYDATYGKISS